MGTDPSSGAGDSTSGLHPLHPKRVARRVTGSGAASSTGVISAAVVIIASKLGVNLSAEESVVIVAAAARIAEWLEKRQTGK